MISSTDFNKIFGRNLRRVMAEQDVSQAQMSRDLDIPKTTISGWMNGKRAPKMSMFDKICNYLSCKLRAILAISHSYAVCGFTAGGGTRTHTKTA